MMTASTHSIRDRVLETARRNPDMTAAHIAAHVGCHPSTVHRHLPNRGNSSGSGSGGVEPPPAPDIGLGDVGLNGPGSPLAEFADIEDTPRPVGADAADDPSCPPDTLRALSREPYSWQVHAKIAGHPNCPEDAMEMYQYDEDEDVRFALYTNPNCPEETREEIEDGWSVDVRQRGAARPHCRPELLSKLASDPDAKVRRAVAANPNTPAAQREQLADGRWRNAPGSV